MVRSYLLDKGLYEDVLVLNSMSAGIKTKAEIPIWEMEERILTSDLTHRLRLCLSDAMPWDKSRTDLLMHAEPSIFPFFYAILLVINII